MGNNLKVAFVYDRVNKIGGAERVLEVFHELYPDAPLYTAVYNRKTARWADAFKVKTTFLKHIPFAKTNHEYIAWLAPLAFESLDFSQYDVVISITSEYAKGIITKPSTLHICYCLTPTRYLWSGYDEYFKGDVFRALTKPLVSYLRTWDKVAAQRPDYYIAISKAVAKRIKKYYGRESTVIYPPVTLGDDRKWTIEGSNLKMESRNSINPLPSKNAYFLLVSRLVPYKRVDIVISAFNKLGLPLKIIGAGRELGKLQAMAGPTIEFLQNLTDSDLSRYYQDCTAFVFPAEEDFGLVNIEAQSFGKPVIAFRGGGALETIIVGKTGKFFYPQTAEALMGILINFDPRQYDPNACRENAEKFSKERFKKEFAQTVKKLVSGLKL